MPSTMLRDTIEIFYLIPVLKKAIIIHTVYNNSIALCIQELLFFRKQIVSDSGSLKPNQFTGKYVTAHIFV